MNTYPSLHSAPPLESTRAAEPFSRRKNSRGDWIGRLLVVALAVGLWVPRLSGPIDLRYDAGVYFLLGTSLAQGHGYRITSEPGEPEAVQYPPGLPAWVAVHAKLFRTTDPVELGRWLRRSNFVLFVAFALSVFALASLRLRVAWATAATFLCLLQFNTYLLSDMLFSELPFALVSVSFISAMLRPWKRAGCRETVTFALATTGFFLRSAGIALLAAWVAEAMFRRQWRRMAIRAALSLLPFGLWQAHVASVHSSPAYQHPAYTYQRAPYQFYNVTYAENIALVDPFRPELGRANARALLSRFFSNIKAIPAAIGESVSTSVGFWRWGFDSLQKSMMGSSPLPLSLTKLPLLSLAGLAILGLLVFAGRRNWVFPFFIAASLALICVTPWPGQFSRYLAPLSALLVIAAVVGARWIQIRLSHSKRRIRLIGYSLLGLLLLLTLSAQIFTGTQIFLRRQSDPRMPALDRPEHHHLFYHDKTWAAWESAATWIRDHARPNEVVATVAPHLCYLWTGHKSIFPPMEADATRARQLLEAVPVSYVIVDELAFLDITRVYAQPAMAGPGSEWKVVYSIDGTRVYARPSKIENSR